MAESSVILLVEDNPDDAALTVRALRQHRAVDDIVVAHDGAEALDYLFATGAYAGRDLQAMPRLVLLDLKVPKVDGLEVLRRMRENARTRLIPVVVLTASQEEQDLVKSYDFGANSYVCKPVDWVSFSDAVRHLGLYWLHLNEPTPERAGE
jgi:CheY-like chemotaxis protein